MPRAARASNGALREHLEWMRLRGLAETTIEQRRRCIHRLERRTQHAALLQTAASLDAYQRTRLSANAGSRSVEISHLQAFFRWAVQKRLLRADPAAVLIQPRRPKRVPRPIPEPDLLIAITQAPDRIRPWLVLAAYAGLRACEVARLDRADVLERADPPVVILRGKGDKERVVPLNQTVIDALYAHGLPARGPLFRRQDGTYGANRANVISNEANRYLHSVGVSATLHQLRHRAATQLYQQTLDLRLVQSVLGHSSPATTAGYAAFASEKMAASMRLLDGPGREHEQAV